MRFRDSDVRLLWRVLMVFDSWSALTPEQVEQLTDLEERLERAIDEAAARESMRADHGQA